MEASTEIQEKRGRPSHRGDLRGELLEAACTFVEQEGHEQLSMRRLAEEVGVSSGAPYHHFPDRRALLIAVALEGYRRMLADEASAQATGDYAREHLYQTCRSFIDFAVNNPRMFTLMYESELVRPHLAPEIAAAQNSGFLRLHRQVAAVAGHLPPEERGVRASTLWCAIFGFALQCERQMIRTPAPEPQADELADAIVRQALRLLDD